MSREIELSNLATFDLQDIHDFIAADSFEAANHVADRIWKTLEKIAISPGAGSLHPDFPGLRRFPAGRYVIYYRLREDIIWVQRILHGSRDAERLL